MDKLIYRVVGIRKNDDRVILSAHQSKDVAERVLKLLCYGTAYKMIEIENDDGKPARAPPPPPRPQLPKGWRTRSAGYPCRTT